MRDCFTELDFEYQNVVFTSPVRQATPHALYHQPPPLKYVIAQLPGHLSLSASYVVKFIPLRLLVAGLNTWIWSPTSPLNLSTHHTNTSCIAFPATSGHEMKPRALS